MEQQGKGNINRRKFLTGLGVAAGVGSSLALRGSRANAQSPTPTLFASPDPPSAMLPVTGSPGTPAAPASIPSLPANPNILVIMVDQMRQPQWLDSSHYATYPSIIPNIWNIRKYGVSFSQYYVAATACTPSRSCLMTGLYTPQTAMYVTEGSPSEPHLNALYPTWGHGIQRLNTAFANNVWWFGKWHLSAVMGGSLATYGFNTGLYPSATNPSPNGFPNEGTSGGLFNCAPIGNPWYGETLASDAEIVTDFASWIGGGYGPLPSQWCATVSLINPHDIGRFPYWLDQYTGGCQSPTDPGYATEAYFNPPGTPSLF